jgi:hypothetical protein
MSDEQEAQPLSGEARRLANLKPSAKGRSGNPGGHPKDLAKFAERGIDVSEAGEQTSSLIDCLGLWFVSRSSTPARLPLSRLPG